VPEYKKLPARSGVRLIMRAASKVVNALRKISLVMSHGDFAAQPFLAVLSALRNHDIQPRLPAWSKAMLERRSKGTARNGCATKSHWNFVEPGFPLPTLALDQGHSSGLAARPAETGLFSI
jgi:hypothetical protein